MPPPSAVILNCAGMGTRLGLGQTKALIELLGRPLIHWQLDLLTAVSDVRVVVGYNAQSVINAVLPYRRDVLFVTNHRYAETNTGDSLVLGAQHVDGDVVSLDGDLLVAPRDLAYVLEHSGSVLGIGPETSDGAIFATVVDLNGSLQATGFTVQRTSPWEWTGLIKLPTNLLLQSAARATGNKHHVYELVQPLLPMRAIEIETREIDTPDDYARAAEWLARHSSHGRWHR